MHPILRRLLPSIIGLMMASCTPIVDSRGHSQDAQDLTQVIIGETRAEDVAALLGNPTTKSNFGDEIWYYVTQKQEHVGVFAPEVTEQRVTAISFNADHVVENIELYKKEDGKPVQMVSKTTPTEGHKVTFMEQMLGNLGRFNAPGRGLSNRDMGR